MEKRKEEKRKERKRKVNQRGKERENEERIREKNWYQSSHNFPFPSNYLHMEIFWIISSLYQVLHSIKV